LLRDEEDGRKGGKVEKELIFYVVAMGIGLVCYSILSNNPLLSFPPNILELDFFSLLLVMVLNPLIVPFIFLLTSILFLARKRKGFRTKILRRGLLSYLIGIVSYLSVQSFDCMSKGGYFSLFPDGSIPFLFLLFFSFPIGLFFTLEGAIIEHGKKVISPSAEPQQDNKKP
jgi:hypothetical protein